MYNVIYFRFFLHFLLANWSEIACLPLILRNYQDLIIIKSLLLFYIYFHMYYADRWNIVTISYNMDCCKNFINVYILFQSLCSLIEYNLIYRTLFCLNSSVRMFLIYHIYIYILLLINLLNLLSFFPSFFAKLWFQWLTN